MKHFKVFVLFFVVFANSAIGQLTIIQNPILPSNIVDKSSIVNGIPDVRFTGVGNLISNSSGSFNQSGNISGEFNLGSRKQLMILMGFNLGNKLDSSYRDSVGLKDIFYPDRSRIGFYGLLSWDILRSQNPIKFTYKGNTKTLWDLPNTMNLNNVSSAATNKVTYWQALPTIELSYQNRNFIDMDSLPTNTIESMTLLMGMRLWYKVHIGDNVFGFTGFGYWKQQTVSDGTLSTYRALYNSDNNGQQLTPHATFLGVSLGLLINDALISFTYEDLKTKQILAPGVSGGVFLVKFSLGSQFLSFN